jgi:hypothetical protein
MRRAEHSRWGKVLAAAVLSAILFGSAGLNCDQNAQADFRNTATSAVADGVKTIIDGLIDGWAAAVQNAGDGSSNNS